MICWDISQYSTWLVHIVKFMSTLTPKRNCFCHPTGTYVVLFGLTDAQLYSSTRCSGHWCVWTQRKDQTSLQSTFMTCWCSLEPWNLGHLIITQSLCNCAGVPRSSNLKSFCQFLGLSSYYRRFTLGYVKTTPRRTPSSTGQVDAKMPSRNWTKSWQLLLSLFNKDFVLK